MTPESDSARGGFFGADGPLAQLRPGLRSAQKSLHDAAAQLQEREAFGSLLVAVDGLILTLFRFSAFFNISFEGFFLYVLCLFIYVSVYFHNVYYLFISFGVFSFLLLFLILFIDSDFEFYFQSGLMFLFYIVLIFRFYIIHFFIS